MDERDVIDIIVIGAGPAGVVAALRAADLGARTALVARDEFGGMAANDGDELAHVPLSFPTYAGILGRVAASVTRQLNRQHFWKTS